MKTDRIITRCLNAMAAVFIICSCTEQAKDLRTEALDSSAWEVSKWISVEDAPIVTSIIIDPEV